MYETLFFSSIVAQELYIKRGTVGLTIGSDHTFLKLRHRATLTLTYSLIDPFITVRAFELMLYPVGSFI